METQMLTEDLPPRPLPQARLFPEDEQPKGRHARRAAPTEDDPTQRLLTQEITDPRRLGRNNSGLSDKDQSDVICILHPATPQSIRIVQDTAHFKPTYALQNEGNENISEMDDSSQADTIVLPRESQSNKGGKDIALRFSSPVNDPTVGFCFGRNRNKCDINLDPASGNKRISNVHFRIYYTATGVLMLEDLSTNGTVIDDVTLGGKRQPGANPTTRMVQHGSIIEILSNDPEEIIKFIVRIPNRGSHEDEWHARFAKYMQHVRIAQEKALPYRNLGLADIMVRRNFAAPLLGPPNDKPMPPPISNRMMKWNGGGRYNEVSVLGKGAFAVVYQLACPNTGNFYAAKELEKKRFMRNGQLDTKLESEMQIMKDLRHPNIVQYVECEETQHQLYIIMEFVPGGDLQGYMAAYNFLSEDMGREMSKQILDALAYLHAKSITHRDIKPDNILISTVDPFVTKLTDFGLSKVVKNNETFLKTFCGTLLYCAPEVFPDFEIHHGIKRRRGKNEKRAYSQLVDIWSYAAVLWFCLSGKPPFEGIMDPQGRAMLERIMTTPLNPQPLIDRDISEECVDLLLNMLDVNPSTRPTEIDCLNHVWINPNGSREIRRSLAGLEVIEEDEEHEFDESDMPVQDPAQPQEDEDSGSSFGDVDRSHLAKRPRVNDAHGVAARILPPRQGATLESNGDAQDVSDSRNAHESSGMDNPSDADDSFWAHVPLVVDNGSRTQANTTQEGHTPRLFGEIPQSALQSSGLLGREPRSTAAMIANSSSPMHEEIALSVPRSSAESYDLHDAHHAQASSRSLGGAEEMVRDLHMTSPEHSSAGEPNTPHTPNGSHDGSFGSARQHQTPSQPQTGSSDPDPTPKARFDRRIRLPPAPSMWYDPYDTSTHNIEYAIQKSGIDFHDPDEVAKYDAGNLPVEMDASLDSLRQSYQEAYEQREQASFSAQTEHRNSQPGSQEPAQGQEPAARDTLDTSVPLNSEEISETAPSTEFVKPLPRLGRLTSLPGSFTDVIVPLSGLRTSYGRLPACTVVHHQSSDTRVPKVAFQITFEVDEPRKSSSSSSASAPESAPASAAEETTKRTDEQVLISPNIDKLQAYIRTWSSKGIRINDVLLPAGDEASFCYGKIYAGDEVCVSFSPDGARLAFGVDVFQGKSRVARSKAGFEVLRRNKDGVA